MLDRNPRVEGTVFFTATRNAGAHAMPPHDELARHLPIFTVHQRDIGDRFPAHLGRILHEPDADFANAFENGTYRQDRSFVRQVAKAITEPGRSPFVLLGNQQKGYELCLHHVDAVLGGDPSAKAVIIVEGPPGSGKSVLAAQLWAHLATDERVTGNVVLTTTSAAQRTNWSYLFENVSGELAARGIVKPATSYNPGITAQWVKDQRELGRRIDPSTWKENLALYSLLGGRDRCPENCFDVSIVDEAHALVDPTKPGTPLAMGVVMQAGPQAWHIIRSSRISVFLLDGDQSFRDVETTTANRIEELAGDLSITRVERLNLAGAQFRCSGSSEYMSWLDELLGLDSGRNAETSWHSDRGGPFRFEIVEDPAGLDERLSIERQRGASVRLAASFARKWRTQRSTAPWDEPAQEQDFSIDYTRGGTVHRWVRPWNYAPAQDYTLFIQAPPGSRMAQDPLAEVGCPYVLRGFDYDYLGVLWFGDLVWRGEWRVDVNHVHETAWAKTRAAAKREAGQGPATQELIRRLQRGYRILLSRAIRGVFVWFEDEATRLHVTSELRPESRKRHMR